MKNSQLLYFQEDPLIPELSARKYGVPRLIFRRHDIEVIFGYAGIRDSINYSAGKRDRGKKHPFLPGAKPPDSIEQEAKPPVQWKVLKNGFNVS